MFSGHAAILEPALNKPSDSRPATFGRQITKPSVQMRPEALADPFRIVFKTIIRNSEADSRSNGIGLFSGKDLPCHFDPGISARNCLRRRCEFAQ